MNYEGESIKKKQHNLFLGEIDLLFFDVIALKNDALGPTVFHAISPELKPGFLSLTHSSTAATTSSLDRK